jgi:hypothetical protein
MMVSKVNYSDKRVSVIEQPTIAAMALPASEGADASEDEQGYGLAKRPNKQGIAPTIAFAAEKYVDRGAADLDD